MAEDDADDLVDEMKEKLESELFPKDGLYSTDVAGWGEDSEILIHILEKTGVPKDLVMGTPGYDKMYDLVPVVNTEFRALCEEVCVPLHQFFDKARVTRVKRMPIDWNRQQWYRDGFENDYTTYSSDVELIAGVSPVGFLVGVYAIGKVNNP